MVIATKTATRPCALGEACPHCGGEHMAYARGFCSRSYSSASTRARRRRSRGERVSVVDELAELADRLGVSPQAG